MKRLFVFIFCLLIVSACDTGGSSSGGAALNAGAGGYLPVDLENTTTSTSAMEIGGAITHNTGAVDSQWVEMDQPQIEMNVIEVESRNGYIARFAIYGPLTSGSYTISGSLDQEDTADGTVLAGLLYLLSPDPARQFNQSTQGTITLEFDEDAIYGTFEFTAQNPTGDSVVVKGQYHTERTEPFS